MASWSKAAHVDDVPRGEVREVLVDGVIVALANVDGQIHAMDGVCAHQGGPLGKGKLCGAVLTCPWHGWQYDVTTGRHKLTPNIQQTRFPVKVAMETIYVDVSS